MIVPMESLLLSLVQLGLSNPRNHDILGITFIPTTTTILLLQRPGINQEFPSWFRPRARFYSSQYLGNCLDSPLWGRHMVDHCDGDCKIKEGVPMRELENVSHHGGMGLMLDCNSRQIFRSAAARVRPDRDRDRDLGKGEGKGQWQWE